MFQKKKNYNIMNNNSECKIVNDSGTLIATIPEVSLMTLSKIPGFSDKLIFRTSSENSTKNKVYSLPDLNFEHTYTNGSGSLRRVKLENSGEKYYVMKDATSQVLVYNADHTLWKTISVPKPASTDYWFERITIFSENQINSDNLLELAYSYYWYVDGQFHYESKIINENNVDVFTVPEAQSLRVDVLDGAQDKLKASVFRVNEGYFSSNFYSLPSLTLEKAYGVNMNRVILENSGEKYYGSDYLEQKFTEIYNADHTLWKTILFDIPYQDSFWVNVSFISETKIADDNLLELGYNYVYHNPLMYDQWAGQVINESGLVYLDAPDSEFMYLGDFLGLPTKLVIHYNLPNVMTNESNYHSGVFTIDPTLTENGFQNVNTVSVTPNPAKSVISITSGTFVTNAILYDVLGKEIQQLQSTNLQTINVDNLTSGMYLLKLSDANQKQSVYKIMVSH